MLDWLAETYVDALNVIHYMHDKYAYERLEMALHDYPVHRFMACGIAGLSVAADSLSAIRYAHGRAGPRRHRAGRRLRRRRRVPGVRQQRRPGRRDRGRGWSRRSWTRCGGSPTYRDAEHTQSVLTITSNVVYGKHTGNTPDGRRAGEPFAPGRQPDERPRPPRPGRLRAVGGQAALRRGPGRHLADQHDHPGRAGPHPRRAGRQPGRHARRLHRRRRLPHERQRAGPGHAAGRDGAPGARTRS